MKKILILILLILSLNISFSESVEDLVNTYNFSSNLNNSNFQISNITLTNKTINLNLKLNLSTLKLDQNYSFLYGINSQTEITFKFNHIFLNSNQSNLELDLELNNSNLEKGNYSFFLRISNQTETIYLNNSILNFTIKNSTFNKTNKNYFIINNQYYKFKTKTNKTEEISFLKAEFIKNNDLVDIIELNFNLGVESTGRYNLNYILSDNYGNTIIEKNENLDLKKGNNLIKSIIVGEYFFKSKLNSPYKIKLIVLSKNNSILKSKFNIKLSKRNYTYLDFKRNNLAELIIQNITYNNLTGKVNIILLNIGEIDAINFILKISNHKNILIPYLKKNTTLNLTYNLEQNLTKIKIYLDYYNTIEERYKYNNYLEWPINLTEICGDNIDNNLNFLIDENCSSIKIESKSKKSSSRSKKKELNKKIEKKEIPKELKKEMSKKLKKEIPKPIKIEKITKETINLTNQSLKNKTLIKNNKTKEIPIKNQSKIKENNRVLSSLSIILVSFLSILLLA